MIDEVLKDLEEKAKAATPGPWEVRYRDLDNHEQAKIWAEPYGWLITKGELPRQYHEPSMEFIAAANPQTILALTEALQVALVGLEVISQGDVMDEYAKTVIANITEILEKIK